MIDKEKKEITERLQKLIDRTSNGIVISAAIQKIIDELNPPRPASGTVVWFVNPDNDTWCIGRTYDHGIEWGTTSYMWDSIEEWKPAHIPDPDDAVLNQKLISNNAELQTCIDNLRNELHRVRREMQRYLPFIERCEEEPALWNYATAGMGIATANGYRAVLKEAGDE